MKIFHNVKLKDERWPLFCSGLKIQDVKLIGYLVTNELNQSYNNETFSEASFVERFFFSI